MTSRVVRIDEGAERDLELLHEYLVHHAGPRVAERLLDQIIAKAVSLEENPLRGACVSELADLGQNAFRQVHVPPWRIVYYCDDAEIVVLAVMDGRRDLHRHFTKRLLALPGS